MNAGRRRATHIAHVVPWPNIGGTEVATQRLIQAGTRHGYTGTVLHLTHATLVRDFFLRSGVPAVPYTPPRPSYRSAHAYMVESRRLAGQLRQLEADAVHCADIAAALQVSLAARLAGIPTIAHVRNRYRAFPLRFWPMLSLVRHFVFVSRQTWKEFGYPVSQRRGSVLYDGIAVAAPADDSDGRSELRRSLNIPPFARVAGMVARVNRQKDIITLAHAASQVLSTLPNAYFVIVGDYQADEHHAYYTEVQELLSSLGIQERFLFTGHRSDVQALLDSFDLFVLSTHWEGFPLVILEAMASGLPVVATAVDGIPEVVLPYQTGILVPHGNPADLAEAVRALLSDPEMAHGFGAAGRARVAAEFSAERYTQGVGDLYEHLLRRLQQPAL